METVIGLSLAASPLALLVGLLLLVARRQARRQAEVAQQIALTDVLHARVGAAVAPVVERRRGAWRISVALPVDQPAVLSAVLRTVDEVFGPVRYEVAVRRQPAPAVTRSTARRLRTSQESLSWT